MKKLQFIKNWLSAFFALSYLLVISLSQELHHHPNVPSEFQIFSLIQEHSSKVVMSKSSDSHCLSCHFLVTGNSLSPELGEFDVLHFQTDAVVKFFYTAEKGFAFIPSHYLRGPPTISFI